MRVICFLLLQGTLSKYAIPYPGTCVLHTKNLLLRSSFVQWVLSNRCWFFIPYYAHRATILFLNQTLDNKNNMPKICKTILMQENIVKYVSCCWCCSDVLCYVWLQCSQKFSLMLCCTMRKTVHVYWLKYSTASLLSNHLQWRNFVVSKIYYSAESQHIIWYIGSYATLVPILQTKWYLIPEHHLLPVHRSQQLMWNLYILETMHRNKFLSNNQPDALIIQIYSVVKLYMFRASSLPIVRSFLLYIRHW